MRKAFPRSREHHELTATELLDAYARRSGWRPALPVPVERIAEVHLGLTIDWAELDDTPHARVLGALFPETRTIVLNIRHQDHYERWVGPYEFTLAHELGHWLYDAVPPSQLQLVASDGATVFCRGPSSPDAIGRSTPTVSPPASCSLERSSGRRCGHRSSRLTISLSSPAGGACPDVRSRSGSGSCRWDQFFRPPNSLLQHNATRT